jgi:urease accessory protein
MFSPKVIMNTESDALAQLRLLQLVSPALPVGGFAFSHGLEYAVQAGWVKDGETLGEWIEGVMRNSVAVIDVPLLLRAMAAAQQRDANALATWNTETLAWRETAELHQADVAMGGALAKLLRSLPGYEFIRGLLALREISWVTAFAVASAALQINPQSAALAYLWNFLENQVTSALKLMSFGQTAGQQILHDLAVTIPPLVNTAQALRDDQLGIGAPAVALASAWHETQYSRLFRS